MYYNKLFCPEDKLSERIEDLPTLEELAMFKKQNNREALPTFFSLEEGLIYKCKKCFKKLITQRYGSYAYCLNCFNNFNKPHTFNKTKPFIKPTKPLFIDSDDEDN